MDKPDWTRTLRRLGACSEAVEWARQYPELSTAWTACERGDWMLWLAGKCAGSSRTTSRRRVVLAACACARLALPCWERRYPDDRRPHIAIETAERWARRESGMTLEMVRAAAAAAVAAAASAAAAAYAAAADAAAAAAYADAAYAADAAERTATLRQCADLVRQHYPEPPKIEVRHAS